MIKIPLTAMPVLISIGIMPFLKKHKPCVIRIILNMLNNIMYLETLTMITVCYIYIHRETSILTPSLKGMLCRIQQSHFEVHR